MDINFLLNNIIYCSSSTELEEKIKASNEIKNEEPPQYKVIMLNDDITTMDFVVEVLQTVFQKSYNEAVDLMLTIHKTGSAIVGIYSFDIALSKIKKTHQIARAKGFPLQCIYEKN